jgi:hypothetical protein
MSRLWIIASVLGLALVACGHATSGAGKPDGGTGGDASTDGSTTVDGSSDSGTPGDSGTDTGATPDSGSTSDSGADGGPGQAVTVTIQFDGDVGPGLAGCTGTDAQCRQIPEANVAANGTQVAQVTWRNVNVYDYGGHLSQSTPLATVITNAGLNPASSLGFPYEPHIVFDEFIGRWIITASCLYDCLLVSASSDATGSWQGIYVSNQGNDPGMHLGYDKNGVYIADYAPADSDSNTAGFSYDLFAIPSAEAMWTTQFAPTHLNQTHNRALDAMTIIDHDASKLPTDPAFFVSKNCPSGSCQNGTNFSFDWVVTALTWSATTATYSAEQLIQTAPGSSQNQWLYNTPVDMTQLGSSAPPMRAAESHRVMDAIQFGTHVNAVLASGPCASSCGSVQGVDTKNLMFWVDLDCTTPAACTVSQTAKISDTNNNYVWPSLGVDQNGNVGLSAAAVGASLDPSIVAWGHPASAAAGTLSGPTTVTQGTQPYSCIASPVGFATAVGITTVRDPVDPTKLWTTMQYGESATACVWNTRIFQYQVN